VILAPTSIPAPTIEECNLGHMELSGKKIALRPSTMNRSTWGTIPFNVTGYPALSVCCGFTSSGVPLGMQVVGAPFQEGIVLQVAHAYERAAQWYKRKPNLP